MQLLQNLISFQLPDYLKNVTVPAITDNSASATAGCLFVAILGEESEKGKQYIKDALVKGAKIIVTQSDLNSAIVHNGITHIYSTNIRFELSHIASRFFDNNIENIISVTGTNGKSSTVDITRQIWINAGIKSASIGTLGIIYNNNCEHLSNNLTSPGPIELNKIFHTLSVYKVTNVAIEASSHGIEQCRVANIPFKVCAFTNFSQDHLDYHGSMENYWLAKKKLFSEFARSYTKFVINADDPYGEHIKEIAHNRKITFIDYGFNAKDIKLINIDQTQCKQKITASFFGETIEFFLNINGTFQVYNALCAAGICKATEIDLHNIIETLQHLTPINGRLEKITTYNNADIYIDYAHTPDALKNAILSLRGHTKNRIITLFGCGGNRDQNKRKIMGEISQQYSDKTIITDDNPRNENPQNIRSMILEGATLALEIADRKNAIFSAIEMLEPGDSLLIAGKGHENYQLIGSELKPFSDREIILVKVKQ